MVSHALFGAALILHLLVLCTQASSFATYSSPTCEASSVVQNIAGMNGYPTGGGSSLNTSSNVVNGPIYGPTEAYQSFSFLTLDIGCMLTIYQPDTTALSYSGYPVLGYIGVCYNTSWAYYSLDNCDIPALVVKALASSTASLASAATSPTSTPTAATVAASASASAPVTASAGISDGAVAGVAIGCIAGTVSVLGALYFVRRRRKAAKQAARSASAAGLEKRPAGRVTSLPNASGQSAVGGHPRERNEVNGQGLVELHVKTEPGELP